MIHRCMYNCSSFISTKYPVMKKIVLLFTGAFLMCCTGVAAQEDGWHNLFDGVSFSNWKVGENASTFSVQDGMIVVNGPVAHLFYDGPLNNHLFNNFELKLDIMTTPGSNSGVYFHTLYQESSWPVHGFEVQVNNSHTDWRRSGSLYAIQDVKETVVKDNEWYTMTINVQGSHVRVHLNDQQVVDYTAPAGGAVNSKDNRSLLTPGTFALQGHDPKSKVYYKNIRVKILAD